MNYEQFLESKQQMGALHGFEPLWTPNFLYDFQQSLLDWAIRKGRAAIFADCGLGKTPLQLAWAENVVRETSGKVLILTPLAVGHQTVREGAKFGVECARSGDGSTPAWITVTNYERLHHFNPADFKGVVCDESSILKNFDGVTKAAVTEFLRRVPYRLLCTATAAPNDYIELGTSSEALGEMGFMDMLGRFFKKVDSSSTRADEYRSGMWRFRGHAEHDFWRWVCSWARAVRKPSDLGFPDGAFQLPPLLTNEHVIAARTRNEEFLFDLPAMTLEEQRHERRRTITERCEAAAALVASTGKPFAIWCQLNDEGQLLARLLKGHAVEVSGSDSDEAKEEAFAAFEAGQIRGVISKSSICGLGMNWQHCAHTVYFPSHSFEQWYQSIRRFWRFGQKNPVTVDVVCSEGERGVLANLRRKAEAAERMFERLVELMSNELRITKKNLNTKQEELPTWLQTRKSKSNTHFTVETAVK
jgi:hypothetical protein